MTKPTCRELLEQTKKLMDETQWFAPVGEDCGNVEGNFNELAARVEKVLALAASALDKDGNPSLIASDDFAWAMTEVLRILDGKAGGAEK